MVYLQQHLTYSALSVDSLLCECTHPKGVAFWAAAPKGRCPVEHRGEFPYVRPSFRPSVRPPPVGLKFALPALKFALPALNSALQASNQLSRLQISPPTSNLSSRPQICLPDLQLALQA